MGATCGPNPVVPTVLRGHCDPASTPRFAVSLSLKRPEERQIDKQCQPCRLLCDLNWTELIRWLSLT
uniref:Uncharacterized protein n=1 Tax=Oryza glumipatula TaxID=40148 RepID=A0A0E0B6D6_9ORYZ